MVLGLAEFLWFLPFEHSKKKEIIWAYTSKPNKKIGNNSGCDDWCNWTTKCWPGFVVLFVLNETKEDLLF
jgi:hypothetical protein